MSANRRLSVLLIDNFDSFTFNLVDELEKRDCDVCVWRNDINATRAVDLAVALPTPRLVLLSPGPGTPDEAGCGLELVRIATGRVPVAGICLGHQTLIQAHGGTVGPCGEVVHGKSSAITHTGQGPFAGLPNPLRVGRYHSLAGTSIPERFVVRAHHGDLVMSVEDVEHRLFGVQFHPESILTPGGGALMTNIIRWASDGSRGRGHGV